MKHGPMQPAERGDRTLRTPAEGSFTIRQFIDELRRIRSEFEWSVDNRDALQGVLRSDDQFRLFDPVTAVAYFRAGEFYSLARSCEAARRLGLSFNDCTNLVAAGHYDWHRLSPLGGIRRELMDVVMGMEASTTVN